MNTRSLIIEVTRRCNMSCDHCLRGCQQAIDIDHAHIDGIMQKVDSIGTITFTGGEPSLNVDAIEYALSSAKKYGVEVGSFYIATNGLNISESFVISCLKWYAYCYEKEMCRVDVSNDYYHAACGKYNTDILDGLSFFGRRNTEECAELNLLNEGNALEFGIGSRENTDYGFDVCDGDIEDGDLYLNANGDIISGCDWSYESQESHKVCNVSDLNIELIKEYQNKD